MNLTKYLRSLSPLKLAILIGLVTKVLIFSLGFVVNYLNEDSSSMLLIIMRQFYRWDGLYYVAIAKSGYTNVGEELKLIAFFPLYPILVRLTIFDYQYVNLSALLVSNVSSIVATAYAFKLMFFYIFLLIFSIFD